jgi:hypothetical protein
VLQEVAVDVNGGLLLLVEYEKLHHLFGQLLVHRPPAHFVVGERDLTALTLLCVSWRFLLFFIFFEFRAKLGEFYLKNCFYNFFNFFCYGRAYPITF